MGKAKAPEWLVKAVEYALLDVDVVLSGTEDQIVADAICQAIQDNPQVVTGKDLDDCLTAGEHMSTRHHQLQASLGYFQKHVLFRSEPEVPTAPTWYYGKRFTGCVHGDVLNEPPCAECQKKIDEWERGKASK